MVDGTVGVGRGPAGGACHRDLGRDSEQQLVIRHGDPEPTEFEIGHPVDDGGRLDLLAEPGRAVGGVRRDVPIADDQVVLATRGLQRRAGRRAVESEQQRHRVHAVPQVAVRAVQGFGGEVGSDRFAVSGECERRRSCAALLRGRVNAPDNRLLACSVQALDRHQNAHAAQCTTRSAARAGGEGRAGPVRVGTPPAAREVTPLILMKPRVLVVDDDAALAEMLTIVLRNEGFEPFVVGDGTQALTAVREVRPDLVLLDLMLPGMNGIDVCRVLRADSGVPIVMLTAKSDTVDVVLGLESGADDYMVKPFKPKELVARIRARLRRTEDEPAELLSIGPVEIDVPAHKVTRDGTMISLTPLEFDLLVALARKPRQVFTRDVLLEQVWGYRHPADTRLVNVHVQRLRAKVEIDPENPEIVLTVRGVGYKAGPP